MNLLIIKNILLNIYSFTEKNADVIEMGSGKAGSFTFKFKDSRSKSGIVSVYTIYCEGDDSSIQFTFGNIKKRLGEEYSKLFYEKLSKFNFIKEWKKEDLIGGYSPGLYLRDMANDVEAFKSAVLDFVKKVGK